MHGLCQEFLANQPLGSRGSDTFIKSLIFHKPLPFCRSRPAQYIKLFLTYLLLDKAKAYIFKFGTILTWNWTYVLETLNIFKNCYNLARIKTEAYLILLIFHQNQIKVKFVLQISYFATIDCSKMKENFWPFKTMTINSLSFPISL